MPRGPPGKPPGGIPVGGCGGGCPSPGGGAGGAAPPAANPNSPAIARSVAPVIVSPLSDTLVRNGSNLALSVPTFPRHRSWVMVRLKGSSSDDSVLVIVWVCQPVKPRRFACSKLYDTPVVVMPSKRILRGARSVVSPGGGLSLASKFWDNETVIVCWGSLCALKLVPAGSIA